MPSSFLDNMSSSGFTTNLSENTSKYWIPILLTSAGVGGLSGYLESKNVIEGETPSQRRMRILKSSLLPALGIGGAGALAVTGKSLLDSDFDNSGLASTAKSVASGAYDATVGTPLGSMATGAVAGRFMPPLTDKGKANLAVERQRVQNNRITNVNAAIGRDDKAGISPVNTIEEANAIHIGKDGKVSINTKTSYPIKNIRDSSAALWRRSGGGIRSGKGAAVGLALWGIINGTSALLNR